MNPRSCRFITPHRPFRRSLWLLAGAVLAGCGGGGGGSSGTSAPASVNAVNAYRALTESARVAALAGTTAGGQSVIGTLAVTPGQTATTTPLGTMDVSATALTVTQGTASASTQAATYWFVQGGTDWAASFEADGSCAITTKYTSLPASAALNASGTHIEAQHIANCSSASLPTVANSLLGTITESWSYQTIGSTPYFCVLTVTFGSFSSSSTQVCAEVLDANGTLGTQVQVKLTDLNGAVTTLAN